MSASLSATSPQPPEAAIFPPGLGGDEPAAVLDRLAELFPDTDDVSPWLTEGHRLLAGGHTHFQWTRRIGDAVYVNPGALVHGDAVEFRHCAY